MSQAVRQHIECQAQGVLARGLRRILTNTTSVPVSPQQRLTASENATTVSPLCPFGLATADRGRRSPIRSPRVTPASRLDSMRAKYSIALGLSEKELLERRLVHWPAAGAPADGHRRGTLAALQQRHLAEVSRRACPACRSDEVERLASHTSQFTFQHHEERIAWLADSYDDVVFGEPLLRGKVFRRLELGASEETKDWNGRKEIEIDHSQMPLS